MPAGTLQVAWMNKGADSNERYHVMYGIDGQNRTMRARNVEGRATLTELLSNDLALLPDRINRIMDDLSKSGTCSVPGLNVAESDLKRLDLA